MKRLLFIAAWLLLLQTTAWAGPHWHALSTEQRQALAPLEGRWQQLESQDREIWAQLALRYPSLSAPEQQRMRERMLAWADLPAAERERARRAHARAQRLSATFCSPTRFSKACTKDVTLGAPIADNQR